MVYGVAGVHARNNQIHTKNMFGIRIEFHAFALFGETWTCEKIVYVTLLRIRENKKMKKIKSGHDVGSDVPNAITIS